MKTAEQHLDSIAPPDQIDDVNDDDLAVCPVCHEKTQTYFVWNDRKKIVHCMCKCERDKVAAEEEERRRAEKMSRIREMKAAGLQDPMLRAYTFENDQGDNPAMNKARMYVKNWKDFYAENIGLLLVGPVGTGKTFFAGCVANALLDQAVPVLMTNFSKILNSLGGMFSEDRNKYINSLNEFDLLIIDAYGIIGLNSKDSADKGFLKLSPILFSPQKRLMVDLRRKHAQNEDLSAKRSAACNFGSTVSDVVPSHLLQRQSIEYTPDVDLHRSTVRYPKDVSLACAA